MTNTSEQLIELWETFLFQLDSDEDGPPFLPSGIQADQSQAQPQQSETNTSEDNTEVQKDASASDDADNEANGAKTTPTHDADDSLEGSRTVEA